MRIYTIIILGLLVAISGCAYSQTSDSANTTDPNTVTETTNADEREETTIDTTTKDMETTVTTTRCRSRLRMEMIEDPDINDSTVDIHNYSELSSVQKETFLDARQDYTEILRAAFWQNTEYIRYDGKYYEPRITYC